jgi:hypothetical protein
MPGSTDLGEREVLALAIASEVAEPRAVGRRQRVAVAALLGRHSGEHGRRAREVGDWSHSKEASMPGSTDLGEREVLALAIASEEEDSSRRIGGRCSPNRAR